MTAARNIALLHYTAPPVVGGVESVLGHHARLLSANGNQVSIIAGRGDPLDGKARLITIPLADSNHPEVLTAKQSLDQGELPEDFVSLVALLEQELDRALEGVEILIAHNVCSLHKNLALTAALHNVSSRPGAPALVPWHHDLAWTVPRYDGELHPGWPWDLLRSNWDQARIKHVTVSEGRRRELAALFGLTPGEIDVIPSGLDLPRFFKLEAGSAELMERLGLFQSDLFILLPVRITRRKNIELAVRIVAALRDDYPQASLVVTGPPGPHNPKNRIYLDELRALRDELDLEFRASRNGPCVHFLTDLVPQYLPDAVIADFYRVADIMILPSREEGFGIPLIEAGLSGLPIFASNIPILRELVGQHARFFSPDGDPGEIARMIVAALKDLPGVGLKAKVRREFSWDGVYRVKMQPMLEGLDV